MRDYLEELLDLNGEDAEPEIQDGLARQVDVLARETFGAAAAADEEQAAQLKQARTETAALDGEAAGAAEEVRNGGNVEVSALVEGETGRSVRVVAEALENTRAGVAAGGAVSGAAERSEAVEEPKAAALAGALTEMGQAVQAGALRAQVVRMQQAAQYRATAVSLPVGADGGRSLPVERAVTTAQLGARQVDRVFERDARRYDREFTLF